MLTGTALIPYLITPFQTWTALLLLLFIHLTTNHRAVRAVSMRTLNRQRASLLFRPLLSPPISTAPLPALPPNPIASPLQISQLETVIHLDPSSLHDPDPAHASFVPIATVLAHAARAPQPINAHILLRIFAGESYILYFDRRTRHGFIALKSSATASTALHAWFCAMECAHLDDEVWGGRGAGRWAGGWKHDWAGEMNYRHSYLGELDSDASALWRCARRVTRVWPVIEDALKGEGWDVDTNALETRSGTRFSVVGGKGAEGWSRSGAGGRESKERRDKRNKVKDGGQAEQSSPENNLSFGTTNSETCSPFQLPTREAATTSTSSLPSEAVPHPSRSKLRLRKWLSSALGRSARERQDRGDASTSRDEGAIEKADDVSGKTAIEAEASSSDPPPRYSGVFEKETASEGGEKYGKSG